MPPDSMPRIERKIWSTEHVQWLTANYPKVGQNAAAKYLGVTPSSIRSKASKLHLRLDHSEEFCKEWKSRAKAKKIGVKRPAQAIVMRNLHSSGKLVQTKEQRLASGRVLSNRWKINGHPRGMLGKKHSSETKKLFSELSIAKWADPKSKLNSEECRQKKSDYMTLVMARRPAENVYSRCKRGRREDLGDVFFRSKWEANYARYLNWMMSRGDIHSWKYESKTFWFEAIRRGVRSYTPDFEIMDQADSIPRFVEVKGWMDAKSLTKIKRMAKYYPDVKLEVFDDKCYRSLLQLGRTLYGWEQ